VINTDWFCW